MRQLMRGMIVTAVASLAASTQARGQGSTDWTAADHALGRAGAAQPGGVHKYSFPRGDLTVTVNGVQLRPALALGTWIAFKRTEGGTARRW